MKAIANQQERRELAIRYEETYPYEDYIINVSSCTTTNCELVTWQFPNHEFVQLIFFTPTNAEIFSVSPALVFPEEGEDGQFFTKGEISLFLTRVKKNR
ncbi:hypothetical protein [Ammoniphilus sp. 3BR4]|uniref:hypothetical protein n=1 Tax=Ammoniphilus sp. 3BR4 TaxID=3158265 RepID=UPI0034677293